MSAKPTPKSTAKSVPAQSVRLRVSLLYTLSMLFLMIIASLIGMTLGSGLGSDALKGVTQPDFGLSSRTTTQGEQADEPEPGQDVAFLSESEVLTQVKERMANKGQTPAQPTASPDTATAAEGDAGDGTPEETPDKPAPQVGFPIVSKDGGVLMEVVGVQPDNGSLVLDVNLRNEGTKPVRFLYSFLDVMDDQNRPLSATAEGLPGEIQPLSDTFSGQIRIPQALVEGIESLSVSLTDYPDQKLKLQLSGIPVLQNVD
ncbi:MAG: hypothetical protein HC824_05795 [Synechococcales cyanobacterium RM1_1_8]|nr:hypothetical protein [Synechococcales cyanobacterium RM1_1_8]